MPINRGEDKADYAYLNELATLTYIFKLDELTHGKISLGIIVF
jgi:hypothetical protein